MPSSPGSPLQRLALEIAALPAVRCGSAGQIRSVLAAVRATGVSAAAWSLPGAAALAGPSLFHALLSEVLTVPEPAAAGPHPATAVAHLVFDCGPDAGYAMEALHLGIPCLHVDVPDQVLEKLTSIAEQTGAVLVRPPSGPVLDLATLPFRRQTRPDEIDRVCRDWLMAIR